MISASFLGNPSSVHLDAWRKIYAEIGASIGILYTVHKGQLHGMPVRRVAFLNKILSYVFLGLVLRFGWKGAGKVLHVHGGSGYGLSALLSGMPFIVTIYGSEVLGKHSFLYRFMMRLVLSNAAMITTTSKETESIIANDYLRGNRDSICCFHTGLDFDHIDSVVGDKRVKSKSLKILSVRNCAMHYRTDQILSAYVKLFPEVQDDIEFSIILGNGDLLYFERLREKYSRHDIVFLGEMLGHDDLIRLVADMDLCISFPISDQLSSTVIEVCYLGVPLISSDLKAYNVLREMIPDGRIRFVADFDSMFLALQNGIEGALCEQSKNDLKGNLRSLFSIEAAANKFAFHLVEKKLFERLV